MVKHGQTVVLDPYGNERRNGKEPREATVTRIGRKYFYVELNPEQLIPFQREDNRQKDTGFGYGADWILYESWADYDDRKEFAGLFNFVQSIFSASTTKAISENRITLDKLRRIAGILNEI